MFRFTSFGESHGVAIGGVIEGCPSNVAIDMEMVRHELQRRQGPRQEADCIEILSGVLDGITLGTPLAFIIRNTDARSEDYEQLKDYYRPNHGDYTYQQRFGIHDWRGGGRSSARITVAHVVAGAIVKQILAQQDIEFMSEVDEIGNKTEGDTYGGIVRCTVNGVPAGIGTPTEHRLDADLAGAMLSIPSAIGFEVGDGFATARMLGSAYLDCWNSNFSTQTNHCGGIQGGISNGMPIWFRVAFHPIVTLPKGMNCITADGAIKAVLPNGRHDRCQVYRAGVIVEAMAAITLARHLL